MLLMGAAAIYGRKDAAARDRRLKARELGVDEIAIPPFPVKRYVRLGAAFIVFGVAAIIVGIVTVVLAAL